MSDSMIIETPRLILRHWCDNDSDALYKYASHPDVGPRAGWSVHHSPQYSKEIINTVFNGPEIYAVVLKETAEPVGCCGLIPSENQSDKEAEIAYWIGKPYWGNGYIPEAVDALILRAFNILQLETLWISFYEGNHNSQRVCEKCGCKFHHKEYGLETPLGDIRNVIYYRLLRSEFLSKQ